MAILSAEEWARRAASFNEDAERYDRARPTYPPELFTQLWRVTRLGPEPTVIEVGCGTGQASLSLAERGARLTCVELGENMAVVHSEHFYPEGFDPLFGPIQKVYKEVTGSEREVVAKPIPNPGKLDNKDEEHIAEMNRTGAFDFLEVVRFLWHFERTADEFIDLLSTFSDHWALEADVRCR